MSVFTKAAFEAYHSAPEFDETHPAQADPWSLEHVDYEQGVTHGKAAKRILSVATRNGYPALSYDGLAECIKDDFLCTTDIHPANDPERYENWNLGYTEALEASK